MGRNRDRKRPRSQTGQRFSRTSTASEPEQVMLYGLHAVEAALQNPRRALHRLFTTPNAEQRLAPLAGARGVGLERVRPADLDRRLGPAAVHQGAALDCAPLPQPALDDLAQARLVVVLDQVTDPHNFGAILRSAAAFGVDALVVTARHSPPLTGVVAKAASGGLEHVAVVAVPNLARALDQLGDLGFDRTGLDGEASLSLEDQTIAPPAVLVLGAEGKGLRRLTRENCDRLCRLATCGPLASLNVSNAAAIALHAVTTAPAWRAAPKTQNAASPA